MLRKDRFLVYEYDDVGATAIHWAAKRNKTAILRLLIQNGAKINARDMGGRTALYIASKNNNLPAVKVLLAGKANPSIKTYGGSSPMEVTENEKIKAFLAKATLLHICMPLIPVKRRQVVWESEGLAYFQSADNIYIQDFS